jgi:hypothetical protein
MTAFQISLRTSKLISKIKVGVQEARNCRSEDHLPTSTGNSTSDSTLLLTYDLEPTLNF